MCESGGGSRKSCARLSRFCRIFYNLTLLVPHAVSMLLLEQNTCHLSAARWLRYNTCLLDMPNITVKCCNVLNPATLLPIPGDGDEHNCVAVVNAVCSPRVDLKEIPHENVEMKLFVDAVLSQNNCLYVNVKLIHPMTILSLGETARLMRPPRRLHVTLLTIPLTCMTPHHLLPYYRNCKPGPYRVTLSSRESVVVS